MWLNMKFVWRKHVLGSHFELFLPPPYPALLPYLLMEKQIRIGIKLRFCFESLLNFSVCLSLSLSPSPPPSSFSPLETTKSFHFSVFMNPFLLFLKFKAIWYYTIRSLLHFFELFWIWFLNFTLKFWLKKAIMYISIFSFRSQYGNLAQWVHRGVGIKMYFFLHSHHWFLTLYCSKESY